MLNFVTIWKIPVRVNGVGLQHTFYVHVVVGMLYIEHHQNTLYIF